MARMVSAKKDSIGAILAGREALVAEDGLCLVGLQAVDGKPVTAGAHLFAEDTPSIRRMTRAMSLRPPIRRIWNA